MHKFIQQINKNEFNFRIQIKNKSHQKYQLHKIAHHNKYKLYYIYIINTNNTIMSVIQEDPSEKVPMLTLCCKADITLEEFQKTTTMIVGMSRQGKSTFFNWLMGHRLIGCKNGTKVFYELRNTDALTAAKVSQGMKSVTLIPNVASWNQQTLADMAGFGDKRDYRGVLGVSYMLKGGFEVIERCRFIIVIQSKNLQDQKFFRTIEGFLNMFHFDNLDKSQKQQLLNSTILVVTKAKAYEDEYLQNLQKLASELQDTQYEGTKMRSQILEVIAHILEKKNIFLFNMAEFGQEAPDCNIHQKMQESWKYFPLKQIQAIKPVIRLPFKQDFSRLNKQQKLEFKQQLDNRIESYKHLAQLIKNFTEKASQNIHQVSDYSNQFKKCQQFIATYDIYPPQFNRLKFIEAKLEIREGITNPASKGLPLAKRIFELFRLLTSFPTYDSNHSKIKQFMQQLKIHTKKIFLLLRDAFCVNSHQQQIIFELLFIALRGYREFLMLFQINGDDQKDIQANDICIRIVDRYQSIIQKSPSEIQGNFVQKLIVYKGQKENDKAQIQKQEEIFNFINIISSINEILEYAEYLEKYKELYPGNSTSPKFTKIYLLILNKRASEYKGTKNQKQGIKSFYYLLGQQIKFAKSKKREYLQEEVDQVQMTRLMNEVQIKLIDTLTQMGECLMNQKQYELALQIYLYMGCVESSCQAYQSIIKKIQKEEEQERYDMCLNYAIYCCDNGRVEDGRKAYQKLLSITTKDYKKREKVKGLIKESVQKVSSFETVFLKNLAEKGHLDPEDSKLEEMMQNIKQNLIQKIEGQEEQEKKNQK